MATTSKDTTAAKKTEPEPKAQPRAKTNDQPYGEQALALATDTRQLAESIREDLDELTDRITKFGDVTPGDTDGPTADGVRRMPAAVDDAKRAMQALALAAADLTRQATL